MWPAFAFKHFEHGDIFLIERISLNHLEVLCFKPTLSALRHFFKCKKFFFFHA